MKSAYKKLLREQFPEAWSQEEMHRADVQLIDGLCVLSRHCKSEVRPIEVMNHFVARINATPAHTTVLIFDKLAHVPKVKGLEQLLRSSEKEQESDKPKVHVECTETTNLMALDRAWSAQEWEAIVNDRRIRNKAIHDIGVYMVDHFHPRAGTCMILDGCVLDKEDIPWKFTSAPVPTPLTPHNGVLSRDWYANARHALLEVDTSMFVHDAHRKVTHCEVERVHALENQVGEADVSILFHLDYQYRLFLEQNYGESNKLCVTVFTKDTDLLMILLCYYEALEYRERLSLVLQFDKQSYDGNFDFFDIGKLAECISNKMEENIDAANEKDNTQIPMMQFPVATFCVACMSSGNDYTDHYMQVTEQRTFIVLFQYAFYFGDLVVCKENQMLISWDNYRKFVFCLHIDYYNRGHKKMEDLCDKFLQKRWHAFTWPELRAMVRNRWKNATKNHVPSDQVISRRYQRLLWNFIYITHAYRVSPDKIDALSLELGFDRVDPTQPLHFQNVTHKRPREDDECSEEPVARIKRIIPLIPT